MGWVGYMNILDFQEATSRLFCSIHFGDFFFGNVLKNPIDRYSSCFKNQGCRFCISFW